MRNIRVLMAVLALAGCATAGQAPPAAAPAQEAADAASDTPSTPGTPGTPGTPKLVQGVGSAVVSPLGDFNLVRDAIPPALQAARAAPYRLQPGTDCAALGMEIGELDAVLGADLDVPPSAGQPSLLERGVDEAGHAAVNAVQGAVSGAIPFRGWIRRLTGAERHAKQVTAAITAGSVRRAFLKGVARERGCPSPLPVASGKRNVLDAASLEASAEPGPPRPRLSDAQ